MAISQAELAAGVKKVANIYKITRYSGFREIPSCRFVPMSGADEIRSAK
jgi:hypothetical protein